jgi:SAM-dependent methyltransferase
VTAVPADYDSDPERWASRHAARLLDGDVHEGVAARIANGNLRPVLDVGCGDGRLGALLPANWPLAGLDASPAQLRRRQDRPLVHADAVALPFADGTFGAVAALWMLYHLADPAAAITEANRVLRPGGVFFACTSSRRNDPELTEGYPQSTFDAEEAPMLVAAIFGAPSTDAVSWDGPLAELSDRESLVCYLRSHFLAADIADRVRPPITLTKRGCLVTAVKAPG